MGCYNKDDLDLDKLLDHADTFSEPSLEDPSEECFDQIECDLDLDKFLKQAVMFKKPSLEDPLEESFAQFEFDLELDMIYKQAKALLDPTLVNIIFGTITHFGCTFGLEAVRLL